MRIDFEKGNGLIPVIIQDKDTLQVRMLGYMNKEAYSKTIAENRVTFFSRSRNRLWTKGETSGNTLTVHHIAIDCDADTLLIQVIPNGPTCHKGSVSCFTNATNKGFVYKLESVIDERVKHKHTNSYTRKLVERGINKVAQKVGEEAVELVIEAKDDNLELFKAEAADLLYHYLILLCVKGVRLEDIESVLKCRVK